MGKGSQVLTVLGERASGVSHVPTSVRDGRDLAVLVANSDGWRDLARGLPEPLDSNFGHIAIGFAGRDYLHVPRSGFGSRFKIEISWHFDFCRRWRHIPQGFFEHLRRYRKLRFSK